MHDDFFIKQKYVSIGTFRRIKRSVLFQRYDDDDDYDDDDQFDDGQNNWHYGNGEVIELAKQIFDNLESDEISNEHANHVYHTIQRMKRDFENPKVKTYPYMDVDLDMLLAICGASTWFTTKQLNSLSLKKNENEKLKAELASARKELSKAREDLAKATSETSRLNSASEAGILKAIQLLTSIVSKRTDAAGQANRSNQLNPNNQKFQPPKKR